MVDLVKRRFLKQSLSGLSVCGVATVWDSALLAGYGKQNNFGLQAVQIVTVCDCLPSSVHAIFVFNGR